MNSSPARLVSSHHHPEASRGHSQPSVNLLWGRSFAVQRSNGQIEHGWMLSEEAGYGDAYGEVKAGEVMCVSPDGNTFRACEIKELLRLNRSLSQGESVGFNASSHSALLTPTQDGDQNDTASLFQPQQMRSVPSNISARPDAPVANDGTASQGTRHSPDGNARAASVVLQSSSKAQAGLNSFEDFLNLTTIDQNDSPSKSVDQDRAYASLKSEHSDLLFKYDQLSHRHAAAQAEMQAMMSSAAVSTSAVLSDMYMDLDKGYEELEQSYKREVQSQEALKARHSELELDLQAANERLATLRQDYRAQHSKISDLEARLQSESRFRQQFTDASNQCSELQRQLDQSAKTCAAFKKELEDAHQNIASLQSDISRQSQVNEDLTKQISDSSIRNSVLSEQLDKFIHYLEVFPEDGSHLPKLPDVLQPTHRTHSPSSFSLDPFFFGTKILSLKSEHKASGAALASPAVLGVFHENRIRRQDLTNSPPASASDINAALSKLSPTYLSKRFQNNPGAVRSIVVENIQLATSLQLQNERFKDSVKSLDCERLKVEEMARENSDSIRSLEISKESERLAVEQSRECQQNCDVLIKSIKDKVADAWKVEEQKQLQLEAQINSLKREVDDLASAKQLIAQFKKLAVEHDEKLVRLQNKHETEIEHMKLLHEEECVSLKKQHELDSRQAAARIEELTRSSESAFSSRVQDEMRTLHSRLREEQQRFSAQLESSVESMHELREQRAYMMEAMASKAQDVEELTDKLQLVKKELQRKEIEVDLLRREREALLAKKQADIDFCRKTAEEEAVEMRRRYTQQQADDKQAIDAGWAALKTLREEIEESVLASSQIQLEAILSKMRQNFQLEFEKYEAQLAELAAQVSTAELERQNCEAGRDAMKQELDVSQQQAQESLQLQEKMQQIEQSFIALTAKLEAGARSESHLRDVIHQQEESALMADTVVRQLENRILHLTEINAKAELTYQTELQQQKSLHEKVLSDCIEHAYLIESLKEKVEASVDVESRLRNHLQQQQDAASRERTVDQARLLELQLQLKKCKEELRCEQVKTVKALDEAAGHQKAEEDIFKRAVGQATDDPQLVALLNKLGKCDNGFKWIREASGYVCTGGSHHVTDEQLKRAMNE